MLNLGRLHGYIRRLLSVYRDIGGLLGNVWRVVIGLLRNVWRDLLKIHCCGVIVRRCRLIIWHSRTDTSWNGSWVR